LSSEPGASKEFDLPVGTELAFTISDKLNVLFNYWGSEIIQGDKELFHNVTRGAEAALSLLLLLPDDVLVYSGHRRL